MPLTGRAGSNPASDTPHQRERKAPNPAIAARGYLQEWCKKSLPAVLLDEPDAGRISVGQTAMTTRSMSSNASDEEPDLRDMSRICKL